MATYDVMLGIWGYCWNDESLIQLCARFSKHWRSLQKDMVRSLKAFIVYLYREIVFLTWMTSQ